MHKHDLICIGNAIVDIIVNVEESFLDKLSFPKGSMQIITNEEFEKIFEQISKFQTISGGSAANTAVGFSSFGGAAAFIGKVGNDKFGRLFEESIKKENIFYSSNIDSNMSDLTSKSIVLVTKDAERTMCTFLGASTDIHLSEIDFSMFDKSKIVYFEGYLYDTETSKNTILEICKKIKNKNIICSLSLSDSFCIERHKNDFLNLIREHIDIVFCNHDELKALFNLDFQSSLASLRDIVKRGCVTLGSKGSIVFDDNEVLNISAISNKNVLDTTGAGDLYASGYLFGLSKKYSLHDCGQLGSLASSEIISYLGARPNKRLKNLV